MNWTGKPPILTLEACAPAASASVDAKAAVRLMAASRGRRRRFRPAGLPLRLSRIRVPSLAIVRWTGASLTRAALPTGIGLVHLGAPLKAVGHSIDLPSLAGHSPEGLLGRRVGLVQAGL